MIELKPKQRITVLNGQREELGDGTFLKRSYHDDLDMTAYECEEHTILVRGAHYLKIGGQIYPVQGKS